MMTRNVFKGLSVSVSWIWLGLFALVPSLMVLIASFMTRGDTEFLAPLPTFDNYLRMLDTLHLEVFWNSVYLAAGTTLFCLIPGYPFAYCLARLTGRYRQMLLLLVIIPFWTSSLIRTYALIILFKTKGLVNGVLLGLGIIDQPLQLLYTNMAVFAGLTYSLFPFMVLPLYASIEKLDMRLVEAAKDLGAGRVQILTRVILPLTLPGIVAGCMLVFLPALGMFYIPDLLGGAKTLLIGNLIKNQFLSARDWPFGSALSVVLTAIMVVLVLVYRASVRKTRRGVL
jgi:spermidine/putrescine transport system permease protein